MIKKNRFASFLGFFKARETAKFGSKNWWNLFLKWYGKILLFSFVLTLMIQMVIYILMPTSFITMAVVLDPLNNFDYENASYRIISVDELRAREAWQSRLTVIGCVCLIGMIAFNPDSRKKIKKIIGMIKKADIGD